MILSTPFTRSARANQSLAAPGARPGAPNQWAGAQTRSLDRLEWRRKRQEPPPSAGQRNVSSALGRPYLAAPAPRSAAGTPQATLERPNGLESQHYACASLAAAPSECSTTKSGRDSAMGQLLERVGGTLRRRRWLRAAPKCAPPPPPAHLSRSATIATSGQHRPNSVTSGAALQQQVYANGLLADDQASTGARKATSNVAAAKQLPEAEAIYAEGSQAIDSNAVRRRPELELDASLMHEFETRWLLDERSTDRPDFIQLNQTLIGWLNDELAHERIIVNDLCEDLHDGHILGKLVERLQGRQLDLVEVTQNEHSQRRKLARVLECVHSALQVRAGLQRWSVSGIHGKNVVEIIELLCALARHHKAPLKLPEQPVPVRLVEVQKLNGQLVSKYHELDLPAPIQQQQQQALQQQRDVFDVLVESAPDKLASVQRTLARFVDRHLASVGLGAAGPWPAGARGPIRAGGAPETLEPTNFSDGVLLVLLVGALEGYFVPLGSMMLSTGHDPLPVPPKVDLNNNGELDNDYYATPSAATEIKPDSYVHTQPISKLHNVNLALRLMHDAGLQLPVRAEDIVTGDLKALLRVLYALFSHYKHL